MMSRSQAEAEEHAWARELLAADEPAREDAPDLTHDPGVVIHPVRPRSD